MSNNERRDSPRKPCALPLRFRVLANRYSLATGEEALATTGSPSSASMEGEALNLSEYGIYFKSRENLNVGEQLEVFLTLPRDLTGRAPEPVRFSARVVRVEERANAQGVRGFGARIERLGPILTASNRDD